MKKILTIILLSFFVYFGSWYFSYKIIKVNQLSIQSEDTVPTLFLPVAIISEGTMHLDSYYEFMRDKYPHPDDKDFEKDLVPFYLRRVQDPAVEGSEGTHYVTAFPIITGLLAIPVYVIPYLIGVELNWELLAILGHITGALIMAASGGILYVLLKNFFVNEKKAELLTYVYLFGTINFALLSQAMWQHGTVQLFVIAALYYFLKSQKQTGRYLQTVAFGFLMSLAVLSRPTAVIALPFLLIYTLSKKDSQNFIKQIKYWLLTLVGVIPNVLFFIWYNKTYYYSIFNQGYADQADSGWLGRFPEGFLGLWVSPTKGILVYSPIFILALVAVYKIFKKAIQANKEKGVKSLSLSLSSSLSEMDNFILASFFTVIAHTLVLGKWKHWYGGWSYGYRMASDVIPYLILMLVPIVKTEVWEKYKKVFYILFALSILVQIHGIIFYDGIWHAAYDNGFTETSWLWSIVNSEFAFNARRVLVKFNLLDKACPNCL